MHNHGLAIHPLWETVNLLQHSNKKFIQNSYYFMGYGWSLDHMDVWLQSEKELSWNWLWWYLLLELYKNLWNVFFFSEIVSSVLVTTFELSEWVLIMGMLFNTSVSVACFTISLPQILKTFIPVVSCVSP